MENRSFSVGGKYRYGFNTQEQEPELGSGVTSAEFWMYDGKLGRRWNVDVVLNISFSPYCINHNSPMVFLDPFGNTDFYNTKGEWIGTDGDEKRTEIKVITDRKVAKAIIKTSKKGADYKMELPNGSFQTLPDKVVLDLIVKTFELSITKTAQDPGGNLHEASSRIGPYGEVESVLGYRPTELWSCSNRGAGIDDDRHCIKSGKVSIHTHPTGIIKCSEDNSACVDGSRPTPEDQQSFKNFDLNIIVGMDGGREALTTKEVVNQDKPRIGADRVQTKTEISDPRELRVFFFDKKSTPIWDMKYSALKKISDGSGKKDSPYKEAYDKKRQTQSH